MIILYYANIHFIQITDKTLYLDSSKLLILIHFHHRIVF